MYSDSDEDNTARHEFHLSRSLGVVKAAWDLVGGSAYVHDTSSSKALFTM